MTTERGRFSDGKKSVRILENAYLGLVVLFLYAPIFMLTALSFNAGKSRAHFTGFSLRWYVEMFQNEDIMQALQNTLVIAFLSALIATILGTMAAVALRKMKVLPRSLIIGVSNVPMLNADIVTGISLMLCFIAFKISLGFKTILISHITFNLPYVLLSVLPKLRQSSEVSYEAALDLGAKPLYAFFKVVLPDIMPGVLSGFLLAFTMSLDDFIITHFTRGAGINTISTLVYAEVRKGINPSMYALSTLIFVSVFIILLIANFAPSFMAGKEEKA